MSQFPSTPIPTNGPSTLPSYSAVTEAIYNNHPAWQPSPELQSLTNPLAQAQISVVNHRARSLLNIQLRTDKTRGDAAAQIRNCSHIIRMPFLRMSKALRTNRINAPFIDAGRAFNRELIKAKDAASDRLHILANDQNVSPILQERADLANATSQFRKLDYGEYNDVELPEEFLPPKPMSKAQTEAAADAAAKATEIKAAKFAAFKAHQKVCAEREHAEAVEFASDEIMAMNPDGMLAQLQEQAKHDPNLTPERMASLTARLQEVKNSQIHVAQTRAKYPRQ